MNRLSIASAFVVLCGSVAAAQTAWLDQPLTGWNAPGSALPTGTTDAAARADAFKRCQLAAPATTVDRALEAAGWIPQPHLDRPLTSNDVEIVAGFSSVDASCAPVAFNLFVFVNGRFAGTLSPVPMTTSRDGVAGAVRLASADSVTTEFARFAPGDLECCPSTRVRVTYRIDRGELRTFC